MKLFSTLLAILIALFIFNKFGPPFSLNSTVTQKTDLFTVSGEGKVTVVPDTGIVTLGFNTTKNTVKIAQTEANRIVNSISSELKKQGIQEKDIKTTGYYIYPQYDYNNLPNRITGYQISVSLTVTVRDLDKLNTVIDTSTSLGANTVGNIQLTVNDDRQKQLVKEARDLAVKEAKDKANELSSAAGMSLGRIVNIQESSPSTPRPLMYAADMKVGLGGGSETNIQSGSTDIVSQVTLYYETR